MQNGKTALMAGAFALASTTGFAQSTTPSDGGTGVRVGVAANTSRGKTDGKVNADTDGAGPTLRTPGIKTGSAGSDHPPGGSTSTPPANGGSSPKPRQE